MLWLPFHEQQHGVLLRLLWTRRFDGLRQGPALVKVCPRQWNHWLM